MPKMKVLILIKTADFFKIFFVKTNKIIIIAVVLNPTPINERTSSICPSKIIAKNSRKSSNLKSELKELGLLK